MNFEEMSETIGYDNFTAEIEDGKFVITPADGGIALFAYVATSEENLLRMEDEVAAVREQYEELLDSNAELRDLLERVYGALLEAGHEALADEVITAAYPVKGIKEMEVDE